MIHSSNVAQKSLFFNTNRKLFCIKAGKKVQRSQFHAVIPAGYYTPPGAGAEGALWWTCGV